MSLQVDLQVRLDRFELKVELEVSPGEIVAVLGPNGAGKTTLLQALAGLVPLRAGRVVLDDTVLEDVGAGIFVPPEQRSIGVVFQDYLLFPHLSALDNVAFGLRCRGQSRSESRRHARGLLEDFELADRSTARPLELSGGQAQRVALARALVVEPRLLLLDEPLAALDLSIRAELRRELKRHLEEFQGIRLLVTHDPIEAIGIADRLVVLEAGRVVQSGDVAELAERPRSAYVAALVGLNLFRGRARAGRVELKRGGSLVVANGEQGEVLVVIHPRSVALHLNPPEGTPRNVWRGRVDGLDLEGSRVRVRVSGELPIIAEVTPAAVAELHLDLGGEVWVTVKATEITIYPA